MLSAVIVAGKTKATANQGAASVTILILLSLLFLLTLALTRFMSRLNQGAAKVLAEPPVFPSWMPYFGHAFSLLTKNSGTVNSALAHFQSSKPFTLKPMGFSVYMVTNPKDVSAVFRNFKTLTFSPFVEELLTCACNFSSADLRILKIVLPDHKKSLMDASHDFYRRHLSGTNGNILIARCLSRMQNLFTSEDARISTLFSSGVEVNAFDWVNGFIFGASMDALMGRSFLERPGMDADTLFKKFWAFDERVAVMLFHLPHWVNRKAHAACDVWLEACTGYFKADITPEADKLEMVWERRQELLNAGISERGVAVLTFIIIWALENNAVKAAFWLLVYIIADPDLVSRLRAEIAPAFNTATGSLFMPQLLSTATAPLLNAVYLETMRLIGASSTSRVVVAPTELSGYLLQPHAKLSCPSRAGHMAVAVWGDDVNSFKPERFLETDAEKKAGLNFRPWGGGETYCPGKNFAKNEIFAFVAHALLRFDFELIGAVPAADDMSVTLGVLDPLGGKTVNMVVRKKGV